MKEAICLLLCCFPLYGAGVVSHPLRIHYETINKIELSQSQIRMNFEYKSDYFEACDSECIDIGVVTNDQTSKKLCVEFSKPFDKELNLKLFVCCEGKPLWNSNEFVEINQKKQVDIIKNIHPNCNVARIPLKHKIRAPKTSKAGEHFCLIKYTLLDN